MEKSTQTFKSSTHAITGFRGLNRQPVIEEGETSECLNLRLASAPAMTVRGGRSIYGEVVGTPQSMIEADGKLAWVSGGKLFFDGEEVAGLQLSDGSKCMIEFWRKIFIFPDAKYYDIETGNSGYMADVDDSGELVEYPAEGGVPAMDYVCVHNNRVCGVKGNSIYISSLGNAMGSTTVEVNGQPQKQYGWTYWFTSDGTIAEAGSWSGDVASEGEFTGIISWDNRVVALKDSFHHEVYGDYPSNYSIRSISRNGTLSHKSIVEVNSALYYVSVNAVLTYAGGLESSVSRALAESYIGGVAGTDGINYYLCLDNGVRKSLYVFETQTGTWAEDTPLDVVEFARVGNNLYCLCEDGAIWLLNDSSISERVPWHFVLNSQFLNLFNRVKCNYIRLHIQGLDKQDISIYTSVDGRPWRLHYELPINREMAALKAYMDIESGNVFRIKIGGLGDAVIYGLEINYSDLGEMI